MPGAPPFPLIVEVEVLCAHAQDILIEHHVLAVLPSVQALLNPLSDAMRCDDMSGSLHYHRLEDNEPL